MMTLAEAIDSTAIAIRAASIPSSPLFILGSPRSGTTILANALRKAGYSGFDEGHFLNLIMPIKNLIERHIKENRAQEKGQLLANLDADQFLLEIFCVFKKSQALLNPAELWLDKTPDAAMIYAAPILAQLWPSAAFVFAKRRAIENLASRIKKFSSVPFKDHCTSWSESMAAWRSVRDSGIQGIEVDQYDIAHDPEGVAGRLGAFLGLSQTSIKEIYEEMQNSQPQSTDERSTYRVLSIQDSGWTPQQIEHFQTYCSEEMDAYGYTIDIQYRKNEYTPAI
jgi:hypothetical protein